MVALQNNGCDGQYCPENCLNQKWKYAYNGWKTDLTLRVECGEKRIHIIVEPAKTDITRDIIYGNDCFFF